MATWIYNKKGKPIFIFDGDNIRNKNGALIAWVQRDGLFDLSGAHIGWFTKGVFYDKQNQPIGYIGDENEHTPTNPSEPATRAIPAMKSKPPKPSFRPTSGKPAKRSGWSDVLMENYSKLKTMNEVVFLIGVPGVGKSTYVKNNLLPQKQYYVASTDDIFEEWGKKYGMNYTQAFAHFKYNDVFALFKERLKGAILNNQDIIIDRTNLNKKSRSDLLRMFPSSYKKVAIIFDSSNGDKIKTQLKKREAENGKHIPDDVMVKMVNSIELPVGSEFDEVIYV